MRNKINILMFLISLLAKQAEAKTEVFLGVQGGYNIINAKIKRHTQFNAAALNVSDKADISSGSALGGTFFELGHTFKNSFFLNLQINAFLSGFKKTTTTAVNAINNPITTSLKMKNSFGGALKLGGAFKGILPYAKLGLAGSKWESQTTIRPGFRGDMSKRRIGIEIGAGIDIPLEDRFSIGAEFSHFRSKKISYHAINNVGQRRTITIHPQENRIMFSIKYKLMNNLISL